MKIPNALIERLATYGGGFRFIKVEEARNGDEKSGKRAVENGFQFHPYKADDPALIDHLDRGGNYGVLAGEGLLFVDTDDLKLDELGLPKTLTVRTGSGQGNHGYFRSDIKDNGTISKAGKHMGEVRARYMYVVGPNCAHYSGGTYKVLDDSPVAWLSQEVFERAVEKWGGKVAWSTRVKKDIDEAADQERDSIGMKIPMEGLLDLKELRQMGPDEWQGAHPVHGSTTGQNFTVNTEKNVWHCFRHNTGGGPLSWIAVQHGIIKCEEALPGRLRSETFAAAMKRANELGFKVEFLPEAVPENAKKFFKNRRFMTKFMGDAIIESHPIITVNEEVYVYDRSDGIYIERGIPWIRAIAARMIGDNYKSARISETVRYVMDTTIRKELPESPPELVVVANGVLNILTGELSQYTPGHFMVTRLPVVYDGRADCPIFREAVAVWVSPEDAEVLQKFCGFILLGEYKYAKMLLLLGPTRSGKTTLLTAIENVVGRNNQSHVRLQEIGNDRFATADMFGKLLNVAAELDAGEVRQTDLIRLLTGRDVIRAQRKNGQAFDFRNKAKLIYAMNDLPNIGVRENDAIFLRILIIRFLRQFFIGEKGTDPDIDKKLRAEAPGILNWMVGGFQRLEAEGGFRDSKNTAEVKERYIILKDPFEYFFGRFTETDYEAAIDKGEFYEAYTAFCKINKTTPKSSYEVIGRMKEKNIEPRRVKCGRDIHACWLSIRWSESATGTEEFANLAHFAYDGQRWERRSPDPLLAKNNEKPIEV